MTRDLPDLPPGFLLGTATASYQIEGAHDVDGRGPSIWDTFTHEPGHVVDGSTGDVACDHYHRMPEDVALMRDLGAGGYRFSIAWPRIQPTGRGEPNEAGLDFYDRLVDALLAADVEPFATLYHWDLPQALEDAGGWRERATAEAFAEYAALVAARLGDRVGKWAPVNEPNVVTMLGHALGAHAPGHALMFDALPVAHHLLLGHGLAVQALRAAGVRGEVGTATNHTPVRSLGEDAEDDAAAALYDDLWNRMYADPMLLGRYPDGLAGLLPDDADDLATIHQPLDFYGFNYYNPTLVGAAGKPPRTGAESHTAAVLGSADLPFSLHELEGHDRTDFDWPVVPEGLTETLLQLHGRYPDAGPFYVTENGCSYATGPDDAGVVDDAERVAYLDRHLRAVAAAVARGVDCRGYYAWSLLDNFEWAEGYTQRFGLVHVDYETQRRTPKRSYAWLRDLIASRR